MEVQRESLPGPSTLASASAGSTQDDCEYAESIDSDEHDLESEGSRSSEPVITAASILTQLRCPPASQLARKRRLKVNPPVGKRRGTGHVSASPKGISAAERVKSYPNDCLTARGSVLFCTACKEEVALKKSVISLHIKSKKHERGKSRLEKRNRQEISIIDALQRFDKEHDPAGETLPVSTRVYRVKVVTSMLKAGLPLAKIDCFRDLLEDNGYALTNSSNLRQLLPFILEEEMASLKEEISGKHVSIIFDGTTHVCEAMVVVLRYMSSDWAIKQKVCRLMLLEKSLSGEEVARQIITVLSTELGIPSNLLVAAMRDRASVNSVAMSTVSIVYNRVMDVGCFSHTLDHVGERMKTTVLDEFSKAWIGLFAHSPKSRLLWRQLTGLSPPSYSRTRWWSRFEVFSQLHTAFGDLPTFLNSEGLPPTTSSKLLDILNDAPRCRKLKMELAITIDSMESFVKSTYTLEGDGVLALVTYEHISMLYSAISTEHYPNVLALAKSLSGGDAARELQLLSYAKACVEPAYSYFKTKFDQDLRPTLLAFKAARYFSPYKVHELRPTAGDLDSLKSFPFFDQEIIDGLKSELPSYFAAAEDVSEQVDAIGWWNGHKSNLPRWASAFKLLILVQPSSAAAERVFSLLTSSFTKQESSLEDYIQLSIMLQYNSQS